MNGSQKAPANENQKYVHWGLAGVTGLFALVGFMADVKELNNTWTVAFLTASGGSFLTLVVLWILTMRRKLALLARQLGMTSEALESLERSSRRAASDADAARAELEVKVKDGDRERDTLEKRLAENERNRIRAINPKQYAEIVHQLMKEHGPGRLLLFNVELNTFKLDEPFLGLWKPLAGNDTLREVRLALSPEKYKRWEDIVTNLRADFFSREEFGRKFVACEYPLHREHGEDRIAFALYESERDPENHDFAAVFLINRPFVRTNPAGVNEYLEILEYRGDRKAIGRCKNLWKDTYSPQLAESAERIQRFHARLKNPPDLGEVLSEHGCDRKRVEEIRRIVGVRRTWDRTRASPAPKDLMSTRRMRTGGVEFNLPLRNDPRIAGAPTEQVTGWCRGLPESAGRDQLPCVIWASGFGDGDRPKMAQLISKRMREKNPDLVEVFYRRSGRLEDATCTRIQEDLSAVVDYVSEIPAVQPERLCIVGISLGGYLAAKIAASVDSVGSLVLVAPPFDVVEMLDRFREQHVRNWFPRLSRAPTFADFLKARQQFRFAHWDKSRAYSNYFNNVVGAHYLVDFAIKGPQEFGIQTFLEALGTVTRSGRRVALVYGRNDPVVDAGMNIPILKKEVKSGKIHDEYMKIESIPLAHYFPGPDDQGYPLNTERQKMQIMIEGMAQAIEGCLASFETSEAGDAVGTQRVLRALPE